MAKPAASSDAFLMSMEALSEYHRPPGDSTRYQGVMDTSLRKIYNLCLADGKARNFAIEVSPSINGNQFKTTQNSGAPVYETVVVTMEVLAAHVNNTETVLAARFQQIFDDALLRVENECRLDQAARQVVFQIDPSP